MRPSREALLAAALALGCWGLAAWPRLADLSATMVLADSVGPFLAAARPGWAPHAPPYGSGLSLHYLAILPLVHSLRGAFTLLALLQATVAPLGALAVLRLRPGAWGAALAAGALLAWDPGLLDTTRSGAEGYLAAPWLAACTLGLAAGSRPWGPWLAAGAWAMAVHNHPFALATAPLLLCLPRRRASLGGLLLAAALLAPRVLQALQGTPPTAEGAPGQAVSAWVQQGGSIALLASATLGLAAPRTRALALASLGSGLLMLLMGERLGYLRDHHLRLLAVPLVVGLAALPGAWGLLALALLRWPQSQLPPEGRPPRPGTLGLEEQLVARLPALPLVVDGAWVGGGLAAEPAALMLDLQLRGRALGGEQVAVILSHPRGRVPPVQGEVLDRGDHHALVLLPASQLADWALRLCPLEARLGGAADGRALDPSLPVPAWTCPEQR